MRFYKKKKDWVLVAKLWLDTNWARNQTFVQYICPKSVQVQNRKAEKYEA